MPDPRHIDLHLHLLPGIDDGPADEATSLAFAARLAADGVREATVTPHVGHPDYPYDAIAHGPRRARWVLLEVPFAGVDALLQVNACSLLGRYGEEAHTAAVRLVTSGLAYVVASDGHGWTGRDHTLATGARQLRTLGASPEQVRRLTLGNPRFLLEHGIPRQPPTERAPWRSPHERRVRHAVAAAQRPH